MRIAAYRVALRNVTPLKPDEKAQNTANATSASKTENVTKAEEVAKTKGATQAPQDSVELSDEAKKILEQLKASDRDVRAHEQAHMAAGGQYVRGGANFSYKKGPDGRMYAVAGEVSIDISREKTPEETIRKMQAVQAAAMAPADPSSQDRAVAAQAAKIAIQAQSELAQEQPTDNGTAISGVSSEGVQAKDTETSKPSDESTPIDAEIVTEDGDPPPLSARQNYLMQNAYTDKNVKYHTISVTA